MEHILFNVVFVRHMATSLLFACMKWNECLNEIIYFEGEQWKITFRCVYIYNIVINRYIQETHAHTVDIGLLHKHNSLLVLRELLTQNTKH